MVLRLAVAVVLLAMTGLPATAQNPDSITQPDEDGCGRDPAGLLAGTSPQWVYVYRDDEPRLATGIAYDAFPTYTDFFRAHESYDMNIYFTPDEASQQLLGTTNLVRDEEYDRPIGTMEIEWEQRAHHLFAWPTAGDGLEIMGSWIWDCGHWMNTDFTDPTYFAPGTQPGEPITGERTEIHPPRMVVVHRTNPSTSASGEAVTDILINSAGTLARSIEDHAAGYCTAASSHDCSQWTPVNDRDYVINVTAPPRPPGATTMRWSMADMGTVNAPGPDVAVTATGLQITVPFEGFGRDGDDMVFAKRVSLGWNVPLPVQHVRFTVEELTWLAELDGPVPLACLPGSPCSGEMQMSEAPDELNVYFDVAGQWVQLDEPGLMAASPGDTFQLDAAFDVYLAPGSPWRFFANARECDQPFMAECSANEAGLNEDAGMYYHHFAGTQGVAGEYVGAATSKMCENAGAPACFTMTYRIEELGIVAAHSAAAGAQPAQNVIFGEGAPPAERNQAASAIPLPVAALLLATIAWVTGRRP